jgi:hypothetical protein
VTASFSAFTEAEVSEVYRFYLMLLASFVFSSSTSIFLEVEF